MVSFLNSFIHKSYPVTCHDKVYFWGWSWHDKCSESELQIWYSTGIRIKEQTPFFTPRHTFSMRILFIALKVFYCRYLMDPMFLNTKKNFRYSNVKRYELALFKIWVFKNCRSFYTFTSRDLSLVQVKSYDVDHMYTLALGQVSLYK